MIFGQDLLERAHTYLDGNNRRRVVDGSDFLNRLAHGCQRLHAFKLKRRMPRGAAEGPKDSCTPSAATCTFFLRGRNLTPRSLDYPAIIDQTTMFSNPPGFQPTDEWIVSRVAKGAASITFKRACA